MLTALRKAKIGCDRRGHAPNALSSGTMASLLPSRLDTQDMIRGSKHRPEKLASSYSNHTACTSARLSHCTVAKQPIELMVCRPACFSGQHRPISVSY